MIGKIIKYTFYLIIILIIFAMLPERVLNKLKELLNWDIFLNTLKTGFNKLLNFLKETFGIPDASLFFQTVKSSLANFFQKLANIFR